MRTFSVVDHSPAERLGSDSLGSPSPVDAMARHVSPLFLA
jgi:hypothetical protein